MPHALNYMGSGPIRVDAPSNMDVYLDEKPNYLYKMHHGCGGCNIGILIKFAQKTHEIPSHVYRP